MKIRILSIFAITSLFILGSCMDDVGKSGNAKLKADISTIDAYLEDNNITALKDITGLRFTIDSLGSGHTPRYDGKVTFKYTGKLLNGTVFQTSTLNNESISNLITGFQIGLPQIPNGTKATLYIPSTYAYGSQSQPNIPANSNLVFQITLKSIVITTAEKTQLGSDTVKIEEYLTSSSITNVMKDTSGLRYVVTQLGDGPTPSWFNRVKVSYTGYLLTNGAKGAKFYEGTNEPSESSDSRVVNYIRGFQIGLQKLPKGSKATFYIPSGMGFGYQSVSGSGGQVLVPANSNLIYDIELIDVLEP